jgi:hypothetical protein
MPIIADTLYNNGYFCPEIKQATGDRQQATGNGQRATGDRQKKDERN